MSIIFLSIAQNDQTSENSFTGSSESPLS